MVGENDGSNGPAAPVVEDVEGGGAPAAMDDEPEAERSDSHRFREQPVVQGRRVRSGAQ